MNADQWLLLVFLRRVGTAHHRGFVEFDKQPNDSRPGPELSIFWVNLNSLREYHCAAHRAARRKMTPTPFLAIIWQRRIPASDGPHIFNGPQYAHGKNPEEEYEAGACSATPCTSVGLSLQASSR